MTEERQRRQTIRCRGAHAKGASDMSNENVVLIHAIGNDADAWQFFGLAGARRYT